MGSFCEHLSRDNQLIHFFHRTRFSSPQTLEEEERDSLSRTNSPNIRRKKCAASMSCALLCDCVSLCVCALSYMKMCGDVCLCKAVRAPVLPAASCVAAENRESLWGRDKNGEAAPRTCSTSTTPDPS